MQRVHWGGWFIAKEHPLLPLALYDFHVVRAGSVVGVPFTIRRKTTAVGPTMLRRRTVRVVGDRMLAPVLVLSYQVVFTAAVTYSVRRSKRWSVESACRLVATMCRRLAVAASAVKAARAVWVVPSGMLRRRTVGRGGVGAMRAMDASRAVRRRNVLTTTTKVHQDHYRSHRRTWRYGAPCVLQARA